MERRCHTLIGSPQPVMAGLVAHRIPSARRRVNRDLSGGQPP